VPAVGVSEIEMKVAGGVMLDREAVHGRCQCEVQLRADALGYLAVGQIRFDIEVLVSNRPGRGAGLPQESQGNSYDSVDRKVNKGQ
jgi:hypothetical protein